MRAAPAANPGSCLRSRSTPISARGSLTPGVLPEENWSYSWPLRKRLFRALIECLLVEERHGADDLRVTYESEIARIRSALLGEELAMMLDGGIAACINQGLIIGACVMIKS